jgi:hypothetical protein
MIEPMLLVKNFYSRTSAGGSDGYFSVKYFVKRVFPAAKITGASRKANIPCTPKPGTRNAAKAKQIPLMTRVNPPNVTKFRGSDKTEITGLTKALINPITAPEINATGKLAITTPLKRMSTTNKLKAVTSMDKRTPTIILLLYFLRVNNIISHFT